VTARSELGPAYRIETERLVLRRWQPADAPLLKEAVEASLEHLRPWMPWANEEDTDLDSRVELLREFRAKFDLGQDFVYGIFERDESRVLGGTGLHPRSGPDMREIGYWIHVDHIGRGLATEASAALTKVAVVVDGVSRVEIRCDPENARSAAVPAKLGFTHDATLRRAGVGGDGSARDTMVWTLLPEEYAASPAAAAEIAAFDAIGRRLI
jgi:RimJ/RimL family protein N-acetyltransferase